MELPSGGELRRRVVLWDFDGTLAFRPGGWRRCLVEVLDEFSPGHGVFEDQIRPHLRDGFPWHNPFVAHPELADPDVWWASVGAVLSRALERNGVDPAQAQRLVQPFRTRYTDGTRGWAQCDGAVAALRQLQEAGWTHIILSNHVPELESIIGGIGLATYVDTVLTSALTGYEKTHPEAFALGQRLGGTGAECWMVGDNPIADIAGAQAAGLPTILVQNPEGPPMLEARALRDVPDAILNPASKR